MDSLETGGMGCEELSEMRGRGLPVTLEKDLENLKASEDGVNPKNSIV